MDETTSEILFETLCAVLKSHGIDVTNMRGQCYDGANNVSDIETGLQARIKEISPSALFVHCYAHILNLVIVDAMTTNTTAQDFFGTSSEFVYLHVLNDMSLNPMSLNPMSLNHHWNIMIVKLPIVFTYILLLHNVNRELANIHVWLCANKLSLNIEKSNFVIFYPHQKKIEIDVSLSINGRYLKKINYIKYLGVFIDSHLSWKYQVDHIAKKIKRGIGILSKLRHFVNIKILVNLYYAIIYPFFLSMH